MIHLQTWLIVCLVHVHKPHQLRCNALHLQTPCYNTNTNHCLGSVQTPLNLRDRHRMAPLNFGASWLHTLWHTDTLIWCCWQLEAHCGRFLAVLVQQQLLSILHELVLVRFQCLLLLQDLLHHFHTLYV